MIDMAGLKNFTLKVKKGISIYQSQYIIRIKMKVLLHPEVIVTPMRQFGIQ